MTAEVDVHGGGEVSSPNGNANADSSSVFVNGNRVVSSGDPVVTDLNFNSVELNGKRIVEESKLPLINNEDNKFECEKQGDVDQENERVNLSCKEGELGDQIIDADLNFEARAESGAVVLNDSVDGDEAVSPENGSFEIAENLLAELSAETICENGEVGTVHEIPLADSPEELAVDIEQNTEAASCPVADADFQLDSQVVSATFVKESERGLDTDNSQDGVSDAVFDDLVDSSQETANIDMSSEVAETIPPQINSEIIPVETVQTDPDVAVSVSYITAKPDADIGDSSITESSTSCKVDDVKRDTEAGKWNVGVGESSDCHHVESADVFEVENGPTGDDSAPGCPSSDAKSEIETSFDSVQTEEKVSISASDESNTKPEVSNVIIEGVDGQPLSVDIAAGESCTSDSVEKESTADVKAESETENASVVSCRDMPGDGIVSEFHVVSGSVTSPPDDVPVENEGIQSTGGESEDQRCKEAEENMEIHFAGAESIDQRCKDVEESVEIQFAGAESDDQICKEVEANVEIQFTCGESDDLGCKEVEDIGEILSTCGGSDDKTCQTVEQNEGIKFTGGESNDKTCQEVMEHGGINFTGDENDKTSLEVKENVGIQFTGVDGDDRTCHEVEGIDGSGRGETQMSSPEDSMVDASEFHNVGAEVVNRPFYYLIKVPRYDDKNIREQIKSAHSNVDDKTRRRDAIRDEIQMIRATYKEYAEKLEAAISEERVARELLKSKRQYIDSFQYEITKAKKAISADDIDGRIRNMEYRIAHETLPLKEEKQFIRDIKQLKQLREQFSTGTGKQDEIQPSFDQKDKLEEQLKHLQSLRKEANSLREKVMKAEVATQAVKKKHREESEKLKRLLGQFKAADEIRQEAYKHLQSLKKQAYDKNKQFWKYKDDAKQANDLVFEGDREALQHLCVNQVERVLEQWNNNDEFRKEYVNNNIRSTLRRLKTLDGRSAGPDEEAPVIYPVVNDRVAKNISLPQISAIEKEKTEQVVPVNSEKVDDKLIPEIRDKRNQTVKSKKPAKPSHLDNVSATVFGRDAEIEDAKEKERNLTMQEEEMARKAEENRKDEEAAKLREQCLLEEKAKSQEALERKKRIAEKAQARAALRAQKEAEQKEKEREKRARKKEKRKAVATEDNGIINSEESSHSSETPLEVPQSSELREKATRVTKKPQKASQYTKQAKAKSIPLTVRNRGKRKMQSWMWVLIAGMAVFALFLLGNSGFLLR